MATVREDLEATASLEGGNDSSGTDSSPVVGEGSGGETEAAPVESVAVAGEGGGTEGTAPPPATDGRNRDATGKFSKATTTTTAPKEVAGAPSSTGVSPPIAGGDSSKTEPPKPGEADSTRAPASWRHEARAEWEKAPPAIRAEVARRELEMARAVTEFHPVKQFAQEMKSVLAPIQQSAQARGTTPQRLVADYVNFDRQLSSRDPTAQAAAVAQVIKAYGVDIEALAGALDTPGRQSAPVDRRAVEAEIRAELEAKHREDLGRAEMSTHVRAVQEFAKGPDADLFNDDIRHDMAALIDAAAARRPPVALSLQDAYSQAVWANPTTRAIVQQREQAKRQATAQAATQKSMAAGGSIKSRPASPGSSGGGKSIREDLMETAAEMSGR